MTTLNPAPSITAPDRRLSAIIVIYYTGPVLWLCINSVLAQPELIELVLVVNGSDMETMRRLRELAIQQPRIHLIESGRNIGFAAGCNRGASIATADRLAFINPDCVLDPGTFGAVLDVFEDHPQAWLIGGRLQHPDGREQRGGRREILSPWRAFVELTRLDRVFPHHPYFTRLHSHEDEPVSEPVEVPTVSGAFMMISRAHYERLGGMDDNLFLHFDDADLCIRVRQQGGQVWYAGHVPITHYLSTSDVSRTFIEWHKTRSTSYYFVKHFQKSYPRWTLSGISVLLWLRFALVALRYLPTDLPQAVRRWLVHRRG
ncbi:glycosyltransferase family 2 protein [Ferrovibrio terrae]|uniref:glycosyltransferase family 2 protein n=1 Tax=Ferrovibrio terrae TaxID=2594003 RepID=UPI00313815E3